MDIYALGLSLYEALTGKTAYPPLPPGMDAFRVLCERAKKHVSPTFDSPVVTERPALLSLLKDMTNIDLEKRIKDASEVERRIGEILLGCPAISYDNMIYEPQMISVVQTEFIKDKLNAIKEAQKMRRRVAASCFVMLLIAVLAALVFSWIVWIA